jgi:tRNA(Arg) A34 adenosine deaminase TadA
MQGNLGNPAFMQRAIALATENVIAGEGGPFGAVIVRDGLIIAEGANMVTAINDPTAHAEIVAIRRACAALTTFDLSGCVIYTSCEPCPMCLAAIYWARMAGIFYGNTAANAAKVGFDDALLYQEVAKPLDQRSIPTLPLQSEQAWSSFELWRDTLNKIPY